MHYPKWAPHPLVELHKARIEDRDQGDATKARDPETIITDALRGLDREISDANIEQLRRYLYRMPLASLPRDEGIELLERLITAEAMKSVWVALGKRVSDDRELYKFLGACERGIMGWRGDQKLSITERRKSYQDIFDTVAKLQSLMGRASDFDGYSITQLIEEEQFAFMLQCVGAKVTDADEVSYARFCLSELMPSINSLFNDIGKKAKEYSNNGPVAKKPNSENAEIHYFVRTLSSYCQKTFEQPLHETVATTASVVFDQSTFDADYIRKIVKG